MWPATGVRCGAARSSCYVKLTGGFVEREGTLKKVRTTMLVALFIMVPVLMAIGPCFGSSPS
jgi:hypothetical protein